MCALDGETFFLDSFALRQWDDPNYGGTRVSYDKKQVSMALRDQPQFKLILNIFCWNRLVQHLFSSIQHSTDETMVRLHAHLAVPHHCS
jgi:hypothetical protein